MGASQFGDEERKRERGDSRYSVEQCKNTQTDSGTTATKETVNAAENNPHTGMGNERRRKSLDVIFT